MFLDLQQEQGSPATIFLVDCRKAMLEMHDPNGESEYDMSGQKKPAYSLLQTSLDAVAVRHVPRPSLLPPRLSFPSPGCTAILQGQRGNQ